LVPQNQKINGTDMPEYDPKHGSQSVRHVT
jgi:hypothetical protein